MTKRDLALVTVSVIVLACLAPPAAAQMPAFSVEGKVTMKDGGPVGGVEVVAMPGQEGRGARRIKTRDDGTYKLPFVERGKYRIKAVKKGLLMYSMDILVKTRTGQVEEQAAGAINPKQDVPEYNIDAGRAVVANFVMVPEDFFTNYITGEEADQLNKVMVQANQLMLDGKYAESDAAIEPVLPKVKDAAWPWYVKGVDAAGLGHNADAEQWLTKAHTIDPKMAGVCGQLAQLYYNAKEREKALEWFRKELEVSPGAAPVMINIALVLRELGRKEEAVDAWQKVIETAPTEAPAYTELATLYTDMGQEDKAIAVLTKMEQVAKPDARVWFNIGANYANQERLEQAEQAYSKALELDPNMPEANRELAFVAVRKGDSQKALGYIEKYLTLRPNADDAADMKKLAEKIKAGASAPPEKTPAPGPAPKKPAPKK